MLAPLNVHTQGGFGGDRLISPLQRQQAGAAFAAWRQQTPNANKSLQQIETESFSEPYEPVRENLFTNLNSSFDENEDALMQMALQMSLQEQYQPSTTQQSAAPPSPPRPLDHPAEEGSLKARVL